MLKLDTIDSLVSTDWLNEHLEAPNLIILDATIPKVTDIKDPNSSDHCIPGARFFDIKKAFSDIDAEFPNTCPSPEQFTKASQDLGINRDSIIVVYDRKGIYSSARAWWMFQAFGHQQVGVLDGGLPEWESKGYATSKCKFQKSYTTGNFKSKYMSDKIIFFNDIQAKLHIPDYTIIDARSEQRYNALVDEPRTGLRRGKIPGSKNIPYTHLLDGFKLKPKNEIQTIFEKVTPIDTHLILSCGSGITACIVALAAKQVGYDQVSVYDGSWTEYGSLTTKSNTMNWTKDELVAYTLLYAANSNYVVDNKERNVIIDRVDMNTFQKVHDEFESDNDYQSLQKITEGLKALNYTQEDIADLLKEIKVMFFADGSFDVYERILFRSLKNILK